MENFSDVSDSSVTGAGIGSPVDIVVDPPVLSMEDQIDPVPPVVGESESGGVVPDVMPGSSPKVETGRPYVIVVVKYPQQADMGHVSPALSVRSFGSSG